jgi:hypothetical protein
VTTKNRKGKLPPFVPVIRTTMASPAWKATSFGARCLYIVLRSYLRVDSLNNGKVFRSYREAGKDLGGGSKTSIARWFRELEHYGFIVMTQRPCLGLDGDGSAAHWRLTECPSFGAKGNHIAPTRDFDRWDGVLFEGSAKTESRPQNKDRASSKWGHTGDRKRGPNGRWCPQNKDIGLAVGMSSKEVHNCLPLPTTLKPHTEDLMPISTVPHWVFGRRPYPEAEATPEWHGYTKLPLELRMRALGLSVPEGRREAS